LEKLAIPLILYFTIEVKANKTAHQLLKSLSCAIHDNYMLFGYFVSLKLKDKTKLNVTHGKWFLFNLFSFGQKNYWIYWKWKKVVKEQRLKISKE